MDRVLTALDFSASHKLAFDLQGNELTPSARYDFKFKDYAPWIFRDLRRIFQIDAADYLVSLTGKYILSELGSPGKSGSFFYFSRDYRFIIKTLHHAEHKFLRKILQQYHQHAKQFPNTLISQFYGLHRVKTSFGKKIHFVVMNNLFPPHMDIHSTYDVKGSTVGRITTEDDKRGNPRGTLKDLNWLNSKQFLKFSNEKKKAFLEQVEKDVQLLANLKIMDYSLLLGMHNMKEASASPTVVQTTTPERPGQASTPASPAPLIRTPSVSGQNYRHRDLRRMVTPRDGPVTLSQLATQSGASLPSPVVAPAHGAQNSPSIDRTLDQASHAPLASILSIEPGLQQSVGMQHNIFYQFEGGIRSHDSNGLPGDIIYFLGIIDLLTNYGPRKKLENMWKGLGKSDETKQQISAVPPARYASRFRDFVSGMTKSPDEVERARLKRTPSGINLENAMHELQREHDSATRPEPETVLKAVQAQDQTGDLVLPVLEEARDDVPPRKTTPVLSGRHSAEHKRSTANNRVRLQEAVDIQEARRVSLDELQGTLPARRNSIPSELVPEETEPDGHDSGLATSLDCLPEESEPSRQSSVSRSNKSNKEEDRDPLGTAVQEATYVGSSARGTGVAHQETDGSDLALPLEHEPRDAAVLATYQVRGTEAQFRLESNTPTLDKSPRKLSAEERTSRRKGIVEFRRGEGVFAELERRASEEHLQRSVSKELSFEDEGYEEASPERIPQLAT